MIRPIQIAVLLATAWSAAAFFVEGGIAVMPAAPQSGGMVTLRLANTFGAEASLSSASIVRTGNTFTITQNVNLTCSLASNPSVVSQFVVGPLAAGTYQVVAHINFIDADPAGTCSPPSVTETAAFNVTHTAIPFLDPWMRGLLAVALGLSGVVAVRKFVG